MPHSGSCLCGASKVTVASTHAEQIACHCTDCQKTSGAAHSMNILAKQTDVAITGDHVQQYDSKAASGNTVSRIFCGKCGSALSHKSAAFGDAQAIQTGNFPDFSKIPVAVELFTKDRWSGLAPIAGAAQKEIM